MTATNAEGAKPHGPRKTRKSEETPPPSSLGKGGGEWSRARGHPHHPCAPSKSRDHPSPPAIVARTTLRKALGSTALLGDAISGDTWASWRALLFSILGEPLEPAELELYRQFTQRQEPPGARVDEFYGIVGRRGQGDRDAALLSCGPRDLPPARQRRGPRVLVLGTQPDAGGHRFELRPRHPAKFTRAQAAD